MSDQDLVWGEGGEITLSYKFYKLSYILTGDFCLASIHNTILVSMFISAI